MRPSLFIHGVRLACAASVCLTALTGAAYAQQASSSLQGTVQRPQTTLQLSVSKGMLIRLERPAASVFIADPKIADVQVRSPQLIYVLGNGAGETTLYAMDHNERMIYSATIQVSNNIEQVRSLLKTAFPNSGITVEPFNEMVMLSGVVPSLEAVGEAERLVKQLLGEKQVVINKLQTATPVQVNLQVKIAEVSRSLLKEIGFNIATRDTTGGFLFNLSRGRDFVNFTNTGIEIIRRQRGDTLAFAGKLFGLDAVGAIDALQDEGLVTVLAEPNLTALSGEMASFLAGGEFAIPMPAEDGRVLIEYKQFGVGLQFTPQVLSEDRIALRVRPEVSELSQAGSVTVNGVSVPGLTTRRAETTVELGSGQSFMIAGLLRNTTGQSISKLPLLGDLPIIGALFKSDDFNREETELVIVVTPYIVKPTDAKNIRLPTDGYKAPSDLQRWLFGKTFAQPGTKETPTLGVMAPQAAAQPVSVSQPAPVSQQVAAQAQPAPATSAVTPAQPANSQPAPGFSFQGDDQ